MTTPSSPAVGVPQRVYKGGGQVGYPPFGPRHPSTNPAKRVLPPPREAPSPVEIFSNVFRFVQKLAHFVSKTFKHSAKHFNNVQKR